MNKMYGMNGHTSSGPMQENRIPSHEQGTTFAFRKRWGQIDWRSLASVDVDKIAREMDFQSLQQNIMNVTFCNIESEEFRNVDQNFVKLFRLSQLIIEYLLHCQQYLSEQGSGFEQRVQEIQTELDKAKTELSSQATELKTVKKENKRRKKIIQAYQDMMNAGATGVHSCPVCHREFVSKEYLQSHIHRRHPDHTPLNGREDERKKNIISQEELEKRLMDQMTERLNATETQLKEEMQKKEIESLEKHAKDFEEWKAQEQERMKLELQEFKEPILTDLRSVQQEKAQLEETLLEKQAEIEALSIKKQSHLGHLEGAQELDIGGTKQTKAELEQLKQQLETKVDELHSSMRKQEKMWQKKLQKLSTSHQDQIKDSNEKLSILEHSLQESSLNKEKDKLQSSMSHQLSSMKRKMKDQEQQLQAQRHQLTVLQTRESSPSPLPSSPVRVSENPPIGGRGGSSQAQVDNMSDESVFESESDRDEVDYPLYHTPLPHRPMIKTKFDHAPEVLEDIKRETESILSDALLQRGLLKDVTGLSSIDFTAKMKNLEQERQQRIQTSYNFLEHRDRLVQEIEDISQSDFVFEPPKDGLLHFKQSHKKDGKTRKGSDTIQSADLAHSLPGTSKHKPPKPTLSRLSSSQPMPVTPVGNPVHRPPSTVSNGEIQAHSVTVAEVADSESSKGVSDDEQDVVSDVSLSSLTTSPLTSRHDPPPANPQANTMTGNKQDDEDDSPWDSSEEDSIEELAAPQAGGRTSSTPIKSVSGGKTSAQKIPTLQASIINIEPNPSRRPAGGVPLFQLPSMNPTQDNEEDSFDISEPSFPAATGTGKRNNLKSSLRDTQTIQPMSHTGTSRSALTTVSIDDFADSDFSDLDL